MRVKASTLAGTWYPGNTTELRALVEDLLAGADDPGGGESADRPPSSLRAMEFLQRFLADGAKTWAEVVAAGQAEGLVEWSLRAARRELGLAKVRGGHGRCRWQLPAVPGRCQPRVPDDVCGLRFAVCGGVAS